MSSTLLYLAIVAVWAVVLVPMWLRRDSRLLNRRHPTLDEASLDASLDAAPDEPEPTAYDAPHEPPAPPPTRPRPYPRRSGRAKVIARRRRRTFVLTLLLAASITTVSTGLAPWWTVLPATTLLTGHLALLRAAVGIDNTRRHARAIAAAQARTTTPAPADAPRPPDEPAAEVIELLLNEEVYDQYADDRRAVGD